MYFSLACANVGTYSSREAGAGHRIELITKNDVVLYGLLSDKSPEYVYDEDDSILNILGSAGSDAIWNDKAMSGIMALLASHVYSKKDFILSDYYCKIISYSVNAFLNSEVFYSSEELSSAFKSKLLPDLMFNGFLSKCYKSGAFNYSAGVIAISSADDSIIGVVSDILNKYACSFVYDTESSDYVLFTVITPVAGIHNVVSEDLKSVCDLQKVKFIISPCFEQYGFSITSFKEALASCGGSITDNMVTVSFCAFLAETFGWSIQNKEYSKLFCDWFEKQISLSSAKLADSFKGVYDSFTVEERGMFNRYVDAMLMCMTEDFELKQEYKM